MRWKIKPISKSIADVHGTSIVNTGSSISDLKANLISMLNGMANTEMKAIQINCSYSNDYFNSNTDYSGYLTRVWKSDDNLSAIAVVGSVLGECVVIGLNSGTWNIEKLALNSNLLTQEQVSCAVPTGCSLSENHIYKLGKLCVGSLAIYIADVFSESYIATIAKKPVATTSVLIYQNSTYKNGFIDNATGRIIGSGLTNGYLCQMSFAYITND